MGRDITWAYGHSPEVRQSDRYHPFSHKKKTSLAELPSCGGPVVEVKERRDNCNLMS